MILKHAAWAAEIENIFYILNAEYCQKLKTISVVTVQIVEKEPQ